MVYGRFRGRFPNILKCVRNPSRVDPCTPNGARAKHCKLLQRLPVRGQVVDVAFMWLSPLTVTIGAAFFALAGIHGCATASDDPVPSLVGGKVISSSEPFTRLTSAITSGFTEPAELVVRDPAALATAWRTLHNGVPGNPAPTVDFAQKMVVLVALGQRNTGGYAIRFDSMTVEGGIPVMRYTVTSPGASCMTTQMVTSPVDVVVVRRVDGQAQFAAVKVVQDC